MKAMLIDPARREVRGIEVELTTLSAAFHPRDINAKIALTMLWLGNDLMLVHDNASKMTRSFVIDGRKPVQGRGLLLGYQRNGLGPVSAPLTVQQTKRFVRFL